MLSGKRGVLIFLATLMCHAGVPRNPGEWRGRKKNRKKEEKGRKVGKLGDNAAARKFSMRKFISDNDARLTNSRSGARSRETRWQMLTRKRSNNMHPPALSRLSRRRNAKFQVSRSKVRLKSTSQHTRPNKTKKTIDRKTLENSLPSFSLSSLRFYRPPVSSKFQNYFYFRWL